MVMFRRQIYQDFSKNATISIIDASIRLSYRKSYMRKILFASLAAVIAFISCKEDETLYYNNITMGNIEGDCIVSDQGNTFEITESLVKADLSEFEYGRVILSCDVLKKTAENRYRIRLTNIASVLSKPVVYADSITPEADSLNVDNPVVIQDIWYGGGYINMLLQFAVKTDSQTKHLINLIYNGVVTSENGLENYTFTLRHNAFGDVPTEEDVEDYRSSYGYVSFPVAELIKGDKVTVTLNWHSHKLENGAYMMLESEQKNKKFDWMRTGYEHPQKSSVAIPSAVCLK